MGDTSDADSYTEELTSDQGESDCEGTFDIDESVTESDDDEEEKATPSSQISGGLSINNLLEKYHERQGKQLYIRFPEKLPDDEKEFQQKTKKLSTLIIRAHKPRQKHARFCLVDFSTKDDRDSALKSMLSAITNDENFKGIVVSIPRTENEEFVQKLAVKKLKSIEMKKIKTRLKRVSKQELRSKNFTSSIVVINLPKSVSISEVKKHFPTAVDIQIKPGKGKMNGVSVASITMPSTMEARVAVKRKITLGGMPLAIRFDTKNIMKAKRKKMHLKRKSKNNITLPVSKSEY